MDRKMNDVALPWPEWKVEKLLGRGSLGDVYQAVKDEFGSTMHAAIKIIRIPRDSAEIEEWMDSSISARSYLNGLVHDITNRIVLMQMLKGAPNIVEIDDYKIVKSTERVQWTIYIRMELLTDLNCYRREHPLSYREVLQLGCDICNALEICRKKNIIHRDIKSSNIFVSPYGEYKLGGFGVSKHTDNTQSSFSTRVGTLSYMAPEVYRGEKYGYSIDIYSLGMVLYQLANNGRLPFYPPAEKDVLPGDADLALEKRNKGIPFPDPANGGEQLGNILRKACHIDPGKRYASPEALHADLRKLLYSEGSPWKLEEDSEESPWMPGEEPWMLEEEDDETVWITAPKKTEGAGKPVSRNHYKVMIWTAVVLLGIGTAGILVSLYGSRNIKKESLTAMKANPESITERGSEIAAESDKEIETEEQTEARTEMESEAEEQTEVRETTQQSFRVSQEEIPGDIAAYQKSEELSDDLTAYEFKMDGEVYDLPVPVRTLLEDGWKLGKEDEDYEESPRIGKNEWKYVNLSKNYDTILIRVENRSGDTRLVENCWIYSIYIRDIDFQLPGGVYYGMSEAELLTVLDAGNMGYRKKDYGYSYEYLYNGDKDTAYCDLGGDSKGLHSIKMDCGLWYQ